MKMENQTCRIKPADRLASVSEYYFSKKLKEVAQMNAEGMDVISLGIGSPDMPPSEKTIRTAPRFCGLVPKMVRCSIESQHRDTTAHRLQRRHPARDAGLCQPR